MADASGDAATQQLRQRKAAASKAAEVSSADGATAAGAAAAVGAAAALGPTPAEAGASAVGAPLTVPVAAGESAAAAAGGGNSGGGRRRGTGRRSPTVTEWLYLLASLVTFGVTLHCTFLIRKVKQEKKPWGPERVWTAEELSLYNGTDETLPLLLGCLGNVYDVTAGKKHYGVGQSYNHFCGRDASRAFVSGNFSGAGLTDDVSKLKYDDYIGLSGWRDFYNKTYKHVGVLAGRFYHPNGSATANLTGFERRVRRAKEEVEKRKREEQRHRGCNSRWSADQGGTVWCEEGHPRKLFSMVSQGPGLPTTPRIRCICVTQAELAKAGGDLEQYDGCDPLAKQCQTSPPEK